MLSNPGKPVTIYIVAGITGKSFTKAFTKHNYEKRFLVTEIYPLNENICDEDEFLSSCVNDRPYSQVTEPARAPSGSKDNTEGTSAGFMKVSPEIIRPFPKAGPRETEWRKHGKSRILRFTPEKTENENQTSKKGKRKYSGKMLEKKTVKKKLITVDSSEEEL